MIRRIDKLERGVERLAGKRAPRPRLMSKRKKTVILLLMWLTPGLPPPGPFG